MKIIKIYRISDHSNSEKIKPDYASKENCLKTLIREFGSKDLYVLCDNVSEETFKMVNKYTNNVELTNNGNTGSGSDAHLRLDMNNDDTDYAPNASYTYYKYMNANDTARVYFQPDDNSAQAYGGSDYFKFAGHLVG